MANESLDWHHSPPHRFRTEHCYFLTASTLHQKHLFRGAERLRFLEETLLEVSESLRWELQEWAVFSNHYHWVGWAQKLAESLTTLTRTIHSKTARRVNREDRTPGRKVWHEFWDKEITFESSYYTRLSYVHNNPKNHGLVARPEDYPFCSARRILLTGMTSYHRQMRSYGHDRLRVKDDFEPIW